MAIVHTSQGDFETCSCGNPEGHVGPVWHPEVEEHPAGAVLKGKQNPDTQAILDGSKKRKLVR